MDTRHNADPIADRPHAPLSYPFSGAEAGTLPWSHAEERLEGARIYWLATTRPDGRPHASPLWGVWVDRALYLDGHPQTTWARNVRSNPHASIHLESGSDVVILEGTVEDVNTDAALGAHIVADWHAKYGRLDPDPVGSGMFRFTPSTARAWSSENLSDGTRWQFSRAEGTASEPAE